MRLKQRVEKLENSLVVKKQNGLLILPRNDESREEAYKRAVIDAGIDIEDYDPIIEIVVVEPSTPN